MGSDHLPAGRGPGAGSGPWAAGLSTWPTGGEGGSSESPGPAASSCHLWVSRLSPVSVWLPHLAPKTTLGGKLLLWPSQGP